jgi:hypothetical protein
MAEKRTKMLLERELGELTFSAGQTSTMELPRNYSLAKLRFRLDTQFDRVAGASAGAPKDVCGAQLIKRIEVRKNGREVLKAIDFETLYRLCQMRHKTAPYYYASASVAGYGALSNIVLAIECWLDFAMWQSLQPFDTLLDTTWRGGITTLDLVITWGNANDIMTPAYNPASGGISFDVTPVVKVSTEEYLDPDAVSGEYVENREYGVRIPISATNPKLQHKFNIGNRFRSFVFKTSADGVQIGLPYGAGNILNNIKIMSGTEVMYNRDAKSLMSEQKPRLAIETLPDGYYLVDFCQDGHLSRSVDTTGRSDLTAEMDVTKVGTDCVVEIFPVELVPVPKIA